MIGQNFLAAESVGQQHIPLGFLNKIRDGTIRVVGHSFEPAPGGFISFHIIVEEHRLLARFLDEQRTSDMPTSNKVIHGRVVFGVTQDQHSIQAPSLHQSIEIRLHPFSCGFREMKSRANLSFWKINFLVFF